MDDETWERRKVAAAEYSTYRPRLFFEQFSPTAGSKEQTPPAGTIGIERIDYGERADVYEVMTGTSTVQAWAFDNGTLYLTPAPADGTPFSVVWRLMHQPDELTRTFPTIPAGDQLLLDWLVDADTADETQAVYESGLSSYSIGGTTVKWSQSGGGQASGSTRASRLRQRALSALRDTASTWG